MESGVVCKVYISSGEEIQICKKYLKCIVESSSQRQDGLREVRRKKFIQFYSHARCRLSYASNTSIQSYKKQKLSDTEPSIADIICTTAVVRSETPGFDIKNDCL